MFRSLLAKVARMILRFGERLEQYAVSKREDDSTAEPKGSGESNLLEDGQQANGKEMAEDNAVTGSTWHIIGESVMGASHKRADLPNQDHIELWPKSRSGNTVIIAVSDGHGGSKYFRSDVGAKLAAEKATQVLSEFIDGQKAHFKDSKDGNSEQPNRLETNNLSLINRAAKESVPQTIVREWRLAVREHLRDNVIDWLETSKVNEKELPTYVQYHEKYHAFLARAADLETLNENKEFLECEAKLIQAYGATLLAAAVTENYIIYWQLGDGDIINVSTKGKVSRVMPKDERLIANETTSLCTEKAWRDFRTVLLPVAEEVTERPALIMLSTDGYSNSYSSPEGFERVGADLLAMMREENGVEKVEANLQQWLKETSEGGSGDDITVGLILRRAALQEKVEPEIDEATTSEQAEEQADSEKAAGTNSPVESESVNSDVMKSELSNKQAVQTAPSSLSPQSEKTT